MQTLTLPLGDRETISERPLIKVQQIEVVMKMPKRKYGSEETCQLISIQSIHKKEQ